MDLHQQKAFSLVELLIALVILGILVSLAAPAFSAHIKRSRDESQISLMLSTLHLARSEAVKRRDFVALCSGESCENRHWRKQLLMFTDNNRNGRPDPDEALLRITELDERYHWHWSNFRQRHHVTYQANGMTHALNGTLTLCNEKRAVRQFVINLSGRVRQQTISDYSICSQ